MQEYQIRVIRPDDVLNRLGPKIQETDEEYKRATGLINIFKRRSLRKKMSKLLLEYDKRTLELGAEKPSGYHG